jgi:hypothetical protein
MSNTPSESQGSGQQRRRSGGNRNRNRNRNRNSSSSGGPKGNRNGNRSGNRGGEGGGNRGGNRSGGPRSRKPKPKPLTWWQKLLKAVGLYKEPQPGKGRKKSEPKSNVRNARSESKPARERRSKSREEKTPRERPSADDVNTKRIYLGNLSYEATESDLEELFRGVGTVRRVEIVYNRRTHRSKGYGFVEMLNVDEAKRAVEVLHDQFFMGRKLNVSGAKSQGPAGGDGDDGDEPEESSPAPTAEESQPPAEPQKKSETKPD